MYSARSALYIPCYVHSNIVISFHIINIFVTTNIQGPLIQIEFHFTYIDDRENFQVISV